MFSLNDVAGRLSFKFATSFDVVILCYSCSCVTINSLRFTFYCTCYRVSHSKQLHSTYIIYLRFEIISLRRTNR